MPAKPSRPSFFRAIASIIALGVSACQQAPVESDGHKVTKTKRVNGKDVNMLESTDKDVEDVKAEAAEMKKSSDKVVFTPAEQQEKK